MSDTSKKKNKKKVIIKVLVIFLVAMGLLTFFSNTIMNMTLTQVSTQQVYGATLSSISRSSGMVHANVEQQVKAPSDLKIAGVNVYLYQEVEAGDVLAVLDVPEERTDLEEARKALEEAEKQMEYDNRKPSENSDFYDMEMAVYDARKAVDEAKKNLENAKNKDTLIAQTKSDISTLEGQITSLKKESEVLSNKQEEAEGQRSMAYENLAMYQETYDAANATLSSATAQRDQAQSALDTANANLAACISDPADPNFSQETLDACNQAVVDAQEVLNTASSEVESAQSEVDAAKKDLDSAQAAYDSADATVASYISQITDKENAVAAKETELQNKQTDLEGYEGLPTTADAERTLKDAQHTLTASEKSLNDARINAGISSDQEKDAKDEKEKELEKLRDQVKKLEEQYGVTEVVAPISGSVIAINVDRNSQCMKDDVLFVIADMNSGFYMECPVSKNEAANMYIGCEVKADYCDSAYVESMRPDPMDPMNSVILRVALEAQYIQPGASTISCTIATSNRSYENVVPKGAVQEDSEGKFIYILVTKNSPLGERYIAKKVPVKVIAEDATSCAIEGAGVSFAYCIIRTEKPIQNGEQVRLAQGEAN
ncbi:MAG: hypothetical protein KBT07_02505 [Clostridiales bacterium]|nr:hypothetical protein [Candidatus Scatonaster coprocaballi]